MTFLALCLAAVASSGQQLTEDQAVREAVQRSRDVIAARLAVSAAEVDQATATVWSNPVASYTASNLVLPPGNPQGQGLSPGFLEQPIHTLAISQVLDVWLKKSRRREVADKDVAEKGRLVEQAVREVAWAVRSAFSDALHAEATLALLTRARERYDETVRLTKARLKAGDISDADERKIELEMLRAKGLEVQAQLQAVALKQKLAALLTLEPEALDAALVEPRPKALDRDEATLVKGALEHRGDLLAARLRVARAQSALDSQKREALPDVSVGLAYTRDFFTISGDNPQSLAVAVGVPLPLFDRNQNGVGHAQVDLTAAQNDEARLELVVRHDVADAVHRAHNATSLLELFDKDILGRADAALKLAEKAFHAGSSSLLELLEAERTDVDVKQQYLDATTQYRQALIDVAHAAGDDSP